MKHSTHATRITCAIYSTRHTGEAGGAFCVKVRASLVTRSPRLQPAVHCFSGQIEPADQPSRGGDMEKKSKKIASTGQRCAKDRKTIPKESLLQHTYTHTKTNVCCSIFCFVFIILFFLFSFCFVFLHFVCPPFFGALHTIPYNNGL